MKQVNFSHSGGFPLEQETLERLQTAYRSELFAALQSHLSIEKGANYIVAFATEEKTGWAIIHQNEKDAVGDPAGVLYPIQKANKTDFLKTTRTGTNLTYGDGTSQTAYFDYDAVYIDETEFNIGVPEDSDALTVNYYRLSTFTIVKDLKTIEEILAAIDVKINQIKADINLINQSYLPLNGSKAMQGDLDLGGNKLSMSRTGLPNPITSKGRALVDSGEGTTTSISLNYQSDWQKTNIGGKVYLNDLNTSTENFADSENFEDSLLLMDGANQVSKNNNLLKSLLSRITNLEEKQGTAILPIGMIAIWGRSANEIPAGWEEYAPLRGKMPVGFNSSETEFNTIAKTGGSKLSSGLAAVPTSGYNYNQNTSEGTAGKLIISSGEKELGENLESIKIVSTTPNINFSVNTLNPYRVVYFIEYTGSSNDTAPTNLTASNIALTSLTLTWTAPTNNAGVSNYILYKNGTEFATLGSILSCSATDLTPNTLYSFSVVARDVNGNLSAPSVVEATTLPDTIAPTTPTGLICYPTSENHITLEWNPSTDNVAVYRYLVFRRKEGESSEVFLGTPDNFGTVLGTPGENYYFKVKALDAAGNESPFTSEVLGYADSSVGDPGDEDPGNSCFDVESLVTMASGQSKKLKNIVVGDKLQGFSFPNEIDESDGDYMIWNGKLNEATKAEVTVVSKITSVQPDYYEIKTADTTMKVTGQHPLLVTEDGENVKWICVKNVLPNMLLIDKTGNTKTIESIVFKEEPLEVALLDVENVDNYVVSGIVAHNNKPADPRDPQP